MKNSNLRNILILVGVTLLVAYFQWQENRQAYVNPTAPDLILAISWQPAFCELRPNKPECRSQRNGRFDTRNFSLHGLWPQPRDNVYCGVSDANIRIDKSGRWQDLPQLELSHELRKKLRKQMPGYISYLHRHEWYKHGVCLTSADPELYFEVSLNLLESLNDGPLIKLFNENIGREITSAQIFQAFEKETERGFGNRISISCNRDRGRNIINELKISISTKITSDNISGMSVYDHSPALPIGCKRGIVDPVGLQ